MSGGPRWAQVDPGGLAPALKAPNQLWTGSGNETHLPSSKCIRGGGGALEQPRTVTEDVDVARKRTTARLETAVYGSSPCREGKGLRI